MKIAAVTNFLETHGGAMFGAEYWFARIVIQLKKRGHSIDVFALNISPEYRRVFAENDIDSTSFDMKHSPLVTMLERPLTSIYMFFSTFFLTSDLKADAILNKIASQINSKDYDVVILSHHVHTPQIISKLSKPTLYSCHEPPREIYERIPKAKHEVRILYEMVFWLPKNIRRIYRKYKDKSNVMMATIIMSNSEYSRKILRRVYGRDSLVCHGCIDQKIFRKMNIQRRDIILSIGNYLSLAKGHDFVIRALGRIRRHHPKLIIVGRGPKDVKEFLQNLAVQYGVALEFLTNLSTEQLVKLYNEAKITAIAYHKEPFGLVAIESMACGTPVVAVREGGLCESVTEDTGILTERDEDEFARAIEILLDNKELRENMGKHGIERVKEYFTYEERARFLEKKLEEIVCTDSPGE